MSDGSSKKYSLIFLSLLCFALADIRDGLGPFLGVYLQEQGWDPDEIGFVMTAGGLAELLCVTPLGALADHTRRKRGLIASSVGLIVAGCGLVFLQSGALSAGFSRILQSVAAAAIAPSLTGITLGMVGQRGLPARLGVNEAWSHAGNASTAVMGGVVGYFFGIPGVFFVMVLMGCLAAFSLARINPAHIDYAVARGLSSSSGGSVEGRTTRKVQLLFGDKALLAVAFTLFFLSSRQCRASSAAWSVGCGEIQRQWCGLYGGHRRARSGNHDRSRALGIESGAEKRVRLAFSYCAAGASRARLRCRALGKSLEHFSCADS
ncbi:MFS transporter [Mailhella sp.]|uniref:MFS transporter n=1 Tax=Mailhella sp. TaxID=1981029 RepID=UPI003AB26FEE